jgi:hypothetical protein
MTNYLVVFTTAGAAVAATSAVVAGVVLAATCTMLRAAKWPKLESRESVMMFCTRQYTRTNNTGTTLALHAATSCNLCYNTTAANGCRPHKYFKS